MVSASMSGPRVGKDGQAADTKLILSHLKLGNFLAARIDVVSRAAKIAGQCR